ncbi:MFS transporter [Halosaccharopolyspora lacisalsi]|uniref:MFS transporter n=1 Tax=Halosaccharopolyspora lacisalsi TaxID=1000566 RepID=UPI001C71DA34|nr:MFS transporter [Halosaccharopolyspora lacisalsi]
MTALRWLPTGLLMPTLVLYLTSAGLNLAEVGFVTALQGGMILLLELPTGGLADAWGRCPVLAGAAVASIASIATLLAADTIALFGLAFALQGVYRALDSGPLNSWYVDAALAVDPARNLERDLAQAGSVLYAAVATGSLLASGLTVLDMLPIDPLAAALVAALVCEVLHLAAVLVLLREVRPHRGFAAAHTAIVQAPRVIAASVRLGWSRRSLRLLLAVELSWGAGLCALELLWQPRTQSELAGPQQAWVFGTMSAAAWITGAAGAALLPLLIRILNRRVTWTAALLRIVQGATLVTLGLAWGLAGVIVGYVAFYTVHGAANPAHEALLHRRVTTGHRSTVLSLNSLVMRASSLPAGILFGVLADHSGPSVALVTAGLLLTTAAPLYLLSGEPPANPTQDPSMRHPSTKQASTNPPAD